MVLDEVKFDELVTTASPDCDIEPFAMIVRLLAVMQPKMILLPSEMETSVPFARIVPKLLEIFANSIVPAEIKFEVPPLIFEKFDCVIFPALVLTVRFDPKMGPSIKPSMDPSTMTILVPFATTVVKSLLTLSRVILLVELNEAVPVIRESAD